MYMYVYSYKHEENTKKKGGGVVIEDMCLKKFKNLKI